MNFNGMGNIKMMCDGTADYDSNVYFAELEDELHDVHSKNVLLETTVGIKSGETGTVARQCDRYKRSEVEYIQC